ncbi:hypothetical protein P170DRAFT_173449 [Aspergillus steynii IBT 23096]|uniref:Uncharacterized protein n=1 Tax=Aspergillus steynii IBT 23096 TaxID=1392250 RepID=A0A2I2G850_9EURO|nr:uncharacterized protein P170DRAFT_173449 [Aspergillus steynii IBT 23096]PLB49044.1 hypothetical protein P170DRAFT_173449 [Aspergillus steynii IBT 23096]
MQLHVRDYSVKGNGVGLRPLRYGNASNIESRISKRAKRKSIGEKGEVPGNEGRKEGHNQKSNEWLGLRKSQGRGRWIGRRRGNERRKTKDETPQRKMGGAFQFQERASSLPEAPTVEIDGAKGFSRRVNCGYKLDDCEISRPNSKSKGVAESRESRVRVKDSRTGQWAMGGSPEEPASFQLNQTPLVGSTALVSRCYTDCTKVPLLLRCRFKVNPTLPAPLPR